MTGSAARIGYQLRIAGVRLTFLPGPLQILEFNSVGVGVSIRIHRSQRGRPPISGTLEIIDEMIAAAMTVVATKNRAIRQSVFPACIGHHVQNRNEQQTGQQSAGKIRPHFFTS